MGVGICTSLTQSLPFRRGGGVDSCGRLQSHAYLPRLCGLGTPRSFQLTLAVCVIWSAKLRSGFSYLWICFIKVRKHPLCNISSYLTRTHDVQYWGIHQFVSTMAVSQWWRLWLLFLCLSGGRTGCSCWPRLSSVLCWPPSSYLLLCRCGRDS